MSHVRPVSITRHGSRRINGGGKHDAKEQAVEIVVRVRVVERVVLGLERSSMIPSFRQSQGRDERWGECNEGDTCDAKVRKMEMATRTTVNVVYLLSEDGDFPPRHSGKILAFIMNLTYAPDSINGHTRGKGGVNTLSGSLPNGSRLM